MNTDTVASIKHIVIGSGGLQGLSIIGALKKISDKLKLKNKSFIRGFYNLESITCSSIGSVIGFLLCLDYTIDEIMILVLNIKWNKTIKPIGITNIISKFGLVNLDLLRNESVLILYSKFNKNNVTLKELFNVTGINLNITATCLNTNKLVIFNHIHYPDVNIIDVMFASCAIPLLFEPVTINNLIYVDGAMFSPLPIDIVADLYKDLTPNDTILCFEPISNTRAERDNSRNTPLGPTQIIKINSFDEFIKQFIFTSFVRITNTNNYETKAKVIIKKIYTNYSLTEMMFDKEDLHVVFNEGFKCDLTF